MIPALLLAVLAQSGQTIATPGNQPPYAVGVQGVSGGVPIPVSGSLSVQGAANTVGSTVSLNGNSICATVDVAGQSGVGLHLSAGTLAATLTAYISNDATESAPNCTAASGHWYATNLVDTSQTTHATVTVTNPNSDAQYGIAIPIGGIRCAEVCTGASGTTGAANAFLTATTAQPPPSISLGSVDVTDRSARLLGVLSAGSNVIGGVTQSGSWTVTANAGTGTFAVSAAALPLPTGAATSAKQPALGIAGTASSDVLSVQGIASMTPLKVDGSGFTQPVSGTFWQSTQPISAASLPLPTGAATAAKQPALGTAGSASADVITVQGIASGTALNTSDAHTTAGAPLSCRLTDGTSFYTASGGAGGGGTSSSYGSAFPSTGTAMGLNDGTNMQGGHAYDADTGAGTEYLQGVQLRQGASGGSVEAGISAHPLRVDPTGTTTQPVSGTVTANQGGTWNVTNISGTVSLPTGAATSAKQPALGTAGTPSSDVLTVQGATSMTPLKTDGSGVTQPVSGTVAATQSGSWSLAANQSVNEAQINGVAPSMGNGVAGSGVQRVAIASDNTAFTVNAAQSGTWTVQPGNTQNTTPWLVQQSDGTTTPPICNVCAPITATALNGVQRIVTGVSAKKIYVCSWHAVTSAAVNVNLVEGTQASTACDTSQVNVTGPEPDQPGGGVSASNPYAMPYTTVNANDLCIKTSAAATVGGQICYVIK